jgi:hypothetical protein
MKVSKRGCKIHLAKFATSLRINLQLYNLELTITKTWLSIGMIN